MRRRCASLRTITWSRHSRRIDPITRSGADIFGRTLLCEGELRVCDDLPGTVIFPGAVKLRYLSVSAAFQKCPSAPENRDATYTL